jgi:hypothetical protein
MEGSFISREKGGSPHAHGEIYVQRFIMIRWQGNLVQNLSKGKKDKALSHI